MKPPNNAEPRFSLMRPNVFIIPTILGYPASRNLIEILKPTTSSIYTVTYTNTSINLILREKDFSRVATISKVNLPANPLGRILLGNFFAFLFFIKVSKKVDILLISQTVHYPLTLMIIAKLMKKRIIDFVGGSRQKLLRIFISNSSLLHKVMLSFAVLELKLSLRISDRIVLISSNLIEDEPFNKFKHKLSVAYNFPSKNFYSCFKVTKKYSDREIAIGYVGAFTVAKGVYDLAKAVSKILLQMPKLKVMFIGDVEKSFPFSLGNSIQQLLRPYPNVVFTGNIPHEELPTYLNELKLLILPSLTEGFPHVVLEAMACGTPVAATPVGAIQEILGYGRYGYILHSTSPDNLAKAIVEMLNDSRNPIVSESVCVYVRENYTYKLSVNMWRKILEASL